MHLDGDFFFFFTCQGEEESRLKFSKVPCPGDSGFDQWHEAMKMVCRLPGGIPAEFRKTVSPFTQWTFTILMNQNKKEKNVRSWPEQPSLASNQTLLNLIMPNVLSKYSPNDVPLILGFCASAAVFIFMVRARYIRFWSRELRLEEGP